MKRGAVMVGTSALLVCLLGTPQRWAFAQVPPPGSAPPPDSAPAPEGSITAESEPAPPASAEAMEPTALEELLAPIALALPGHPAGRDVWRGVAAAGSDGRR